MQLRGIFAEYSTLAKLLIFIGLSLTLATLLSMMGHGVIFILYGISFSAETLSALNIGDIKAVEALKLLNGIASTGAFLFPSLLLAYLVHNKPIEFLSMHRGITLFPILLVVLIILLSAPAISWLLHWNKQIVFPEALREIELWLQAKEGQAERITQTFLAVQTVGGLLLNLLLLAILPALSEELAFRGVLQQLVARTIGNVHVGILISAMLFSAIHMQFYGFMPRMLLGVLFGYLLLWSGTLWAPCLAHFFHNAYQIVAYYLYHINVVETNIENIETVPLYFTLPSSLLLIVLIYTFYKFYEKHSY